MYRIYTEAKIEIVTQVEQQAQQLSIALKVYNKGKIWDEDPLVQLSNTISGSFFDYTLDNPLPKIMWVLFPNGTADVKTWLALNHIGGDRGTEILSFVNARLAYLKRPVQARY